MEKTVTSRVSVHELKAHLSDWLARAQSGEVVEVTSHHQPIARLVGVHHPAVQGGPDHLLHKAIAAGLISWKGGKPALTPAVQLHGQGPSVSHLVLDDRG